MSVYDRPATVLPAGAAFFSIVPPPGSPAPQLAEGRCLKQMARGRLAGRRQDLGASTWRRQETAAGAPAAAVRWLARAVFAAPVTGFLPGGQPGEPAPARRNATTARCQRVTALPPRPGETHEHR
jgi:hypothetical protein